MGHRVTQRILECSDCGRTPDDGEYMWEMCREYICKECIDKEEEPDCEQENNKETPND